MTLPFSSVDDFRQKFNFGLHQILDKNQLSTFILVLANASNDVRLFDQLKEPLFNQFQNLLDNIKNNLVEGKDENVIEEDLLVFLKLHALGFNNINLTQQRVESGWHCQFNQLRSFRPKRISAFQHNGEMSTPFIESQFNFNKPFMAKERLWTGEFDGGSLDIFYNKYPFSDLHTLLVPQREDCLPQFLSKKMHFYIWSLVDAFSESLPNLGVAYNSYGAYASVNHLHFQMFIPSTSLPVTHEKWRHNGGSDNYPINVFCPDNVVESWGVISKLHNQKQPYNLLYVKNKVFIIPRKVQGSVEVPEWNSGFTWSELCGSMLLFSKSAYDNITDEDISNFLNKLSV